MFNKFQVETWSTNTRNDRKALFRKFVGSKKKLEKKIKFMWFIDRCTKDHQDEYVKNLQIVWDEINEYFSK